MSDNKVFYHAGTVTREITDAVVEAHSDEYATAISPARPALALIRSRLTRIVSPALLSWRTGKFAAMINALETHRFRSRNNLRVRL